MRNSRYRSFLKILFAFIFVSFGTWGCSSEDTESGTSASKGEGAESVVGSDTTLAAASTVASLESSTTTVAEDPSSLMYISVGDSQKLVVAEIDAAGKMEAIPEADLDLSANTGAMVYGRSTDRLYLAVGEAIASIDVADARNPNLLSETAVPGIPVYLALANAEATLISAYFNEGNVEAYTISGGEVPDEENLAIPTAANPHAATFDPSGQRFYVPHLRGDVVSWFDVTSDGSFSLGGEVQTSAGLGPRHIAFSPDGAYAYLMNEFADSVTTFAVADDGSLSELQTLSAIPEDFDGEKNTGADIHVTPNGKFVYSSNRGHDSIAMFKVVADGSLESLGQIPTEARPREFEINAEGTLLVAAGQDSGNLQSYIIGSDGMLTSADTLAVGDGPAWVVIR